MTFRSYSKLKKKNPKSTKIQCDKEGLEGRKGLLMMWPGRATSSHNS